MKRILTFLLAAGLLLTTAAEADWQRPYEELRFQIRWLFVPAGTAVIRQYRPQPRQVRFRMDSCSNATLDLFYPVRDRIRVEAHLEGDRLQPERYEYSQREGHDRSEILLRFPRPGEIVMEDRLAGTTERFSVAAETVDMVTAFFLTRGLPLQDAATYRIPVFDKGKAYALEIEVVGRERLRTVLGRQTPTVKIHPRLKSEGVFRRTGELYIWLTDDDRRIPVRMESSVRIGKIITVLQEVRDRAPPTVTDPPYLCLPPGRRLHPAPPDGAGDEP